MSHRYDEMIQDYKTHCNYFVIYEGEYLGSSVLNLYNNTY